MCDDGSTDRTIEIVKNYIEQHGLEKTWILSKNEKNLGYIKNFYHAISMSDADLIFLSDQDDLWHQDKISRMTAVMEKQKEILLLSCKYGIVDMNDEPIRSIMEKTVKEDNTIKQIEVHNIMQAYRWPGMVMCLRKTFFEDVRANIEKEAIPHDLAFAILAADRNGFYEYNYVGAYHRRHDNNLAREEHRVSKLLNLERKLKDIREMCETLEKIEQAKLPIQTFNLNVILYKLRLLQQRETALQQRKLSDIITLYCKDSKGILRVPSFICDLWLILFGTYK